MPASKDSSRRARPQGGTSRAAGSGSSGRGVPRSSDGRPPFRRDEDRPRGVRRDRVEDDRPGGSRPAGARSGAPRRDDDRRPRIRTEDDRPRRPRADGARPVGGRRDDDRRPRDRFEDDRPRRPRAEGPRSTGARRDDDRRPRATGARPAAASRRDDDRRPRERFDEDRPRRPRAESSDRRPSDRGGRGARPAYRDRRPRELTPEEQERLDTERAAKARGWGSVARKGAVHIKSSSQEMQATKSSAPAPAALEEWLEVDRPRTPRAPKAETGRKPYVLPADIAAEIRKAFEGSAFQREKMVSMFTQAAEAYDRHRFEEALRFSKMVVANVPSVAPVNELVGLAAYRAQRFSIARKHLRVAFELTSDPQHLPLVMDCERAAKRYAMVEGTFRQLNESDPTAEVVAEARIVMAGALADQEKFHEAIELLHRAGASKLLRNPAARHIRLWYALADTLDRAGDASGAREMFLRVVAADPEAYDAAQRLDDLGGTTVRKNRKKRTTPVSKKKHVD